jgi:hypothetical protein
MSEDVGPLNPSVPPAPIDGNNKTTWLEGLSTSLKTQTATWLVALFIGILGLFSSYITESVKFAMNRADLRTKQYEEVAIEISAYIFSAELNTEFIENGWTDKKTMTDLIVEYNTTITSLRKKEFVYAAWVKHYWSDTQLAAFDAFMTSVTTFDKAIHSLNDEFERVNITGKQKKIDPERAKKALEQMKPAAKKLRDDGLTLLILLE